MTQMTEVPIQTADFLLGRMIATAEINKQLNEKIHELKKRIDVQADLIQRYERNKDLLETQIKDLRSANRKRVKK
jgi:ABC-type iron transport system FetAB ATPase subunit